MRTYLCRFQWYIQSRNPSTPDSSRNVGCCSVLEKNQPRAMTEMRVLSTANWVNGDATANHKKYHRRNQLNDSYSPERANGMIVGLLRGNRRCASHRVYMRRGFGLLRQLIIGYDWPASHTQILSSLHTGWLVKRDVSIE